jgi:hypothetical protein
MKNPSNKFIENIIRQKLRKDEKLVDAIMQTLSIGKESAYRRLRGEVPYTFEDIMKVSSRYNISIDAIVGTKMPGSALINTNIVDIEQPIESYFEYLTTHTTMLKQINRGTAVKAYMAFNQTPHVLFSSHYALAKFHLFKWMRQMHNSGNPMTYKEMPFNENIWEMHRNMIVEYENISEVHYVFDKDLFLKQIKDIILFYQLGLIDKESLDTIKKDLFVLLDELQKVTSEPAEMNKKRLFYVANVSFDSSYLYFEADSFRASGVKVLGIGVIITHNEWICEQQRKWIELLKRYSTLISISGEIDRLAFINPQREYVDMLNSLDTPDAQLY